MACLNVIVAALFQTWDLISGGQDLNPLLILAFIFGGFIVFWLVGILAFLSSLIFGVPIAFALGALRLNYLPLVTILGALVSFGLFFFSVPSLPYRIPASLYFAFNGAIVAATGWFAAYRPNISFHRTCAKNPANR